MPAGASLTRLGYDTRSFRSALVMRAVDAFNPFKRAQEFRWAGPAVVSSVAGLGDLFIHLPLIAGVVNECRRREIDVRVALRPAHRAVGERCGWQVMPFDNALEDFFKNPRDLRPADSLGKIRCARQSAAAPLDRSYGERGQRVGDQAGRRENACRPDDPRRPQPDRLSVAAFRSGKRYANRERVAQHLGCRLDFSVAGKLRGAPMVDLAGRSLFA